MWLSTQDATADEVPIEPRIFDGILLTSLTNESDLAPVRRTSQDLEFDRTDSDEIRQASASHSGTPTPDDGFGTAIERTFHRLLRESHGMHFEDGTSSKYSEGVQSLIEDFGAPAIRTIGGFWEAGALPADVAAETLIQLGQIPTVRGLSERLGLLADALGSEHASIRDAAAVALSSLQDPSSLSRIRRALRSERLPQIRDTLEWTAVRLGDAPQANDAVR